MHTLRRVKAREFDSDSSSRTSRFLFSSSKNEPDIAPLKAKPMENHKVTLKEYPKFESLLAEREEWVDEEIVI